MRVETELAPCCGLANTPPASRSARPRWQPALRRQPTVRSARAGDVVRGIDRLEPRRRPESGRGAARVAAAASLSAARLDFAGAARQRLHAGDLAPRDGIARP